MFVTFSAKHLPCAVPGVRGSGVGRQLLPLVALLAHFLHMETSSFHYFLAARLADNIINLCPKLSSTFLMVFQGTSNTPGLQVRNYLIHAVTEIF